MAGKKIVLPVSILMVFILLGCEKYLEYEGEDAKPRLVLNGVFSADSAFSVELSNSQGYVSNGSLNTISNGKVAVFNENGELVDSLEQAGDGIYTGTALAQANVLYEVRASAGALGSIYAIDFAPSTVPIANWDTTTIPVSEYDYTVDKLQIEFVINDPSGTENFYIIEVFNTQYYYIDFQFDPQTGMTIMDTIYYEEPNRNLTGFTTSDPILLSDAELALDETLYYTNSLAFNDALFDGNLQGFKILVETYYSQQSGASLELRLTSCSEAYYKYKRTLESYYYTEGDPFAQPVQVFNNIENGLGIWAGSSPFSVEIGD